MSGAILGWGIDLGPETSKAAKLFENYNDADEENGWSLYQYGRYPNRLALLLHRSVVVRGLSDTDNSVNVQVTLGGSGYPVLSSQPTPEETEDLIELVKERRPHKGEVDLTLDLLLLPLV